MKTAIVYASVHHGNTKKIIDEIAKTNDVELIDATQTVEKDLSEYDLIGFASGVYGGKFHQSVLKFASVNLTDNKNVFLICTYGGTSYASYNKYCRAMTGREAAKLPSTSPANARWTQDKLLHAWREALLPYLSEV